MAPSFPRSKLLTMITVFHLPQALDTWRSGWRRLHMPLLALAVAVFAAGTVWSVHQLDLTARHLNRTALFALLLFALLSLVYSGAGLQLMAKAAGTRIPFGKSITTSAVAILAEALPIPGGAIVRTGALMKAGAGLGAGAGLVLLTAVLWIMLGALGAGLAIRESNAIVGSILAAAGAVGTLVSVGWLWRQAGYGLALLLLVHRLSGIALIAARLYLAFLVLGLSVPFAQLLPFVLAMIAGSSAAIAPAGLGVSEALAALAAGAVAVAPAAAFLAVGLDRLANLLASGAFAIMPLARSRGEPRQPDQVHSNDEG